MNKMVQYPIKQSITDRSTISVDLYLKDIVKYKLLTEEEERELLIKIENGDEKARNKLITSNLRFCITIAKQYQGKGIPLEDLISAANIGLIKASSLFSTIFNCRFLSYAVWWIRDSILKEILINSKLIRIPTDKIVKLNKVNKIIIDFEQINLRPPTDNELCKLSGLTQQELNELFLINSSTIISESISNQEEDINSIFDTLYIEDGNTDQIQDKQSSIISIYSILKQKLNNTEYVVISKYFGINSPELSLDIISEQLNITKERVRQIKDKAIIKLRKCPEISDLVKFL